MTRNNTGGWDDAKELAATTAELLHALYRATLAAAGAKNRQIPKQISIPRPDAAQAQPRPAEADEVMAFFASLTPVSA